MAEVFKAKSYGVEGFEKIIAIKRILPTMGEDRDFIKMFIDEAKIAGQLAHANICQIFELGRIDGSHFIAMEYIWGKDLLQIQNRVRKLKQPIPITLACFVIAKVLEGLDYAHRKRDPLGRPLEIVHRDCSPQNVLVSYEGEVKVIDFGIAKATSRNSRTMAGVLKGKFGYMSPEQVRGLPLDRRSDIFAIGTMLFECLTGERLFQGETDFSTLEKVRNVDIQPPRAINPHIPEAVERVILRALAKDVDERYQWCSEMLADLQQYLMSQDVVFTAKTLSAWLKEMFSGEIDRERSQLEAYKRVGRDGLIADKPMAEARLDVNEHLGEAGAPEGDATTLGGPNFDDLEHAMGAHSEVGPAPEPIAAKPSGRQIAQPHQPSEFDENDFGEEAPTEIFGGDSPAAAAVAPQIVPRATPKPPPRAPNAPPIDAPYAADSSSRMPSAAPLPPAPVANIAPYPTQLPGMPPMQQMQPAMQQQPQYAQPAAPDSFGNLPVMPGYSAPGGPSRTVMGVVAPVGLPNYANNYPPRSSVPPPHQSMPMPVPVGTPGHPMNAPNMGYGAPNAYGQPMNGPMSGQMPAPYYPPPQPYGSEYPMVQPGMMPNPNVSAAMNAASAVDPLAQQVEPRKSTLVRDILIGVLIAAFVLGGFLLVKVLVLDKDSSSGDGAGAGSSSIGTLRVALPAGVKAQLFLDGQKSSSAVVDGSEVPVTAGTRKVKLVGVGGGDCEDAVKVEANKVTTIDCSKGAAKAGSGAGSAKPADTKPADTKPATETKPATDTKPADPKDTKPADPKDTKPADPKDTKPTETKPATIDSGKPAADAKPTTLDSTKLADKTVAKPTVDPAHAAKPPKPTKPADSRDAKPPTTAATDAGDTTGKGFVTIYSKPTAKILVDGATTGRSTPIEKLPLAPGKHKITYVIGSDRFTYPVNVKAGQTETLSKDLE
jgi:serine/threonine protein kinase